MPEPPSGHDVLLEIDLQGAAQVLERCPDAVVVLLVPPSIEVQRERLIARGDSDAHVRRRIEKGREEVCRGRKIAQFEVVNGDLEQTLQELAGIVAATRKDADGS